MATSYMSIIKSNVINIINNVQDGPSKMMFEMQSRIISKMPSKMISKMSSPKIMTVIH